jgi:hypothetical protein
MASIAQASIQLSSAVSPGFQADGPNSAEFTPSATNAIANQGTDLSRP